MPKPNPLLTLCTRKRRQPSRSSLDSKPATTSTTTTTPLVSSVKLTVVTTAGTCKVTSSTAHSDTVTLSSPAKQTKKSKPKSKKSSKKQHQQQKKYNRDWDNESDKESDGAPEGEESCKKREDKISTESQVKCETSFSPVASNSQAPVASAGLHHNNNGSTATEIISQSSIINNYSTTSYASQENGIQVKERTSKKKKKKHSRSDEHYHKKRKHKHKKNRNKYEYFGDITSNTESKSDQGNTSVSGGIIASPQIFPHVEKVFGDLKMRIKSPPPTKLTPDVGSGSYSPFVTKQGSSIDSAVNKDMTEGNVFSASSSITDVKSKKEPVLHTSLRIKDSKEKSRNKERDSNRPKRSSSRTESITYNEFSEDEQKDDSSADNEDLSEAKASEDGGDDSRKIKKVSKGICSIVHTYVCI